MLASAIAGVGLGGAYQPIVDLPQGRVVGYEGLVRFSGYPVSSPEPWFEAAAQLGCAPDLHAAALRAVLTARPSLPRNCFLTLNIGPDVLNTEVVRSVWAEQGSLGGLVVELTEHARIDDYRQLEPDLNALRAAGALLAVDDAGSGYAGLTHLLALRPAMIKLDRVLVRDIHNDEAKRALVEMIGTFADRIDAWLLAEGVERPEELQVLVSLGVPLAQGYLLGRPAPPWTGMTEVAEQLLTPGRPDPEPGSLRALVEYPPVVQDVAGAIRAFADPRTSMVVLADDQQRPITVLTDRTAPVPLVVQGLKVNVDTPVATAALRAVTRADADWAVPLLCTDNTGRYVGIVRVQRLLQMLASAAE